MSQVYRASHRRSYRPVRVLARENRRPNVDVLREMGGSAVVVALGAVAIIDGLMSILIGLR